MAEGGISVHTQAVIVPGKNDGDYLRETIETLEALHPNIESLAVVPVGLTRHREGLPGIRAYRDHEMGAVIDLVEPYRERFLAGERGSRFVFPSDEWYVGAEREVPEFDAYEGFPQLDNGVGSIRSFLQEIEDDADALGVPSDLSPVSIVTGSLGARVFERYVLPLLAARGATVPPAVVCTDNHFFGATVTCSGLLVGADMVRALERSGVGRGAVFIPPNCLNHNGVTIDEMTPESMGASLGCTVVAPEASFIEALHEHAGPGGR
jgi:NifB/MoaA-like Fe-S oxidoreductase